MSADERTCEECGTALPAALSTGRPRRYCSATCRSAARRTRQRADEQAATELALRCSKDVAGRPCGGEVEFVLNVEGRESRVCGPCQERELSSLLGRGVPVSSVRSHRLTDPSEEPASVPSARHPAKGARLLLIEDDQGVRYALRHALVQRGYHVEAQPDGTGGLREAYAQRPDLVLLDLGLPGMDGSEVLKRLRLVSDVPVIVVTARSDLRSRVHLLDSGADDYVVKPFSIEELVARIERVLHRQTSGRWTEEVYDDGTVRLDSVRREAQVAGTPLQLTGTEFRLFDLLVRNAGSVQPLDKLLARAWDTPTRSDTRKVKFMISRLRIKLDATPLGSASIVSARGVGYLYQQPSIPVAPDTEAPAPRTGYGHAGSILDKLNAKRP
ncbi:hypothetical protein A8W25_01045 [Streptomyces sp. ERV7]|uniref:response regulator transcription factor n=1 Tax=Streptomyces sp. ERV7 TaxID=1322334 RepID=UPI0007F44E9C|nr:response regulator transcription factor [Streptomyces sp. ERV7]OAR26911.1 hypothetical protein A8W25_01045 [Streptomyces sp. ERV7]